MWRWISAAAVALMAAGATVVAQEHSGHMTAPAASAGTATSAYEQANAKMHEAMGAAYTGDADVDFAASMIPHHEGAVAMAEIELQYGTDPEMRKLAEAVIAAQTAEIAFLKEWLKARGVAE